MKNKIIISLIVSSLFFFTSNTFAFDLNGCNPIANPLNLCQEQTWYSGVDVKLAPYGIEYFVTLNNGVFSSVPNCSDNVYSMLIKNTSTSQDLVYIENGQYGFCDYGQDINGTNPNIPDGDYFYELYTGNSWGNRVALGYIRLNYTDGLWTAQSSSTDGVCGSADGGSFPELLDNDPNLCSVGTLGSMGVQDDGTTYLWVCEGSNGGTTDYCSANVLVSTAQCGSISGTYYTTPTPSGIQACQSGVLTDLIQNGDDSWSWSCEVSVTDYVSCGTYSSAPTIPSTLPSNDSISCSISPTDFSTFADCLGSILKWAFLPHQSSLDSFYSLTADFKDKVPFGYFYAIADLFSGFSYTLPADLVFTFKFNGSDITLLDVNDFMSDMGSSTVDFYFNILRALLWISFVLWIYAQGRNIFSQNDNEK